MVNVIPLGLGRSKSRKRQEAGVRQDVEASRENADAAARRSSSSGLSGILKFRRNRSTPARGKRDAADEESTAAASLGQPSVKSDPQIVSSKEQEEGEQENDRYANRSSYRRNNSGVQRDGGHHTATSGTRGRPVSVREVSTTDDAPEEKDLAASTPRTIQEEEEDEDHSERDDAEEQDRVEQDKPAEEATEEKTAVGDEDTLVGSTIREDDDRGSEPQHDKEGVATLGSNAPTIASSAAKDVHVLSTMEGEEVVLTDASTLSRSAALAATGAARIQRKMARRRQLHSQEDDGDESSTLARVRSMDSPRGRYASSSPYSPTRMAAAARTNRISVIRAKSTDPTRRARSATPEATGRNLPTNPSSQPLPVTKSSAETTPTTTTSNTPEQVLEEPEVDETVSEVETETMTAQGVATETITKTPETEVVHEDADEDDQEEEEDDLPPKEEEPFDEETINEDPVGAGVKRNTTEVPFDESPFEDPTILEHESEERLRVKIRFERPQRVAHIPPAIGQSTRELGTNGLPRGVGKDTGGSRGKHISSGVGVSPSDKNDQSAGQPSGVVSNKHYASVGVMLDDMAAAEDLKDGEAAEPPTTVSAPKAFMSNALDAICAPCAVFEKDDLNCQAVDSSSNLKATMMSNQFIQQFLMTVVQDGLALILHEPPSDRDAFDGELDWKQTPVKMFVKGSSYVGSPLEQPRLLWGASSTWAGLEEDQSDNTSQWKSVELLDIDDVQGSPNITMTEVRPNAEHEAVEAEDTDADDACFFTVTSGNGDVHVFEALSLRDRDAIVAGLRGVVAGLAHELVSGSCNNTDVSGDTNSVVSQLIRDDASEDYSGAEGDLPSLRTRKQAVNEVTHSFLQ